MAFLFGSELISLNSKLIIPKLKWVPRKRQGFKTGALYSYMCKILDLGCVRKDWKKQIIVLGS